ncbi:MAG TPA: potassium transporter TrkG, partial [Myxococcota bacterium]|nr:potassium transporter TrkG [Myxococcota bacterium]
PVTAIATWLAVRDPDRPLDVASPWPLLLQHPPRLLVASFAAQCLLGAMVLVLPGLTTLPHGVGFLDALFTAVSATCVTGLTVIDPARDLTMAGQLVLLTLIQVGGLGIMTFSAAALFLMARRMSFRAEATAADLLGADDVAHLGRALLRVLSITFTAEAVGTLALTARFWMAGAAPATALWEGAFTAISAFCNAGFAIQPDNLTRYAEDPVVIHVMSALIILGGLGPAIVTALPELRSRAGRLRLSLHVRLVLGATAALLVLPAAFLAATEWGYALADLAPVDRLHNAWFLSVTTRTAGFYTLDPSRLQRSSVTLLTGLMFVGGAPGSTAGGIKVSTLAVLALAVLAAVRGRAEVEIGQRRIPQDVVYRAGAIASLFLLTVGAALVALQLTQPMSTEALLFEVVSATGTAGLSLGVTPYLDDFGKLVVIACMFAGRVGPLTLFLVLGDTRHPARTIRPAEPVPVG